MNVLSSLLVGKSLNILAVAALLLAGYLALRLTTLGAGRQPRALLWALGAWAVYAGWEWLVMVRTPDANIRVDLLLIWPALLVVSVVAVFRALR